MLKSLTLLLAIVDCLSFVIDHNNNNRVYTQFRERFPVPLQCGKHGAPETSYRSRCLPLITGFLISLHSPITTIADVTDTPVTKLADVTDKEQTPNFFDFKTKLKNIERNNIAAKEAENEGLKKDGMAAFKKFQDDAIIEMSKEDTNNVVYSDSMNRF